MTKAPGKIDQCMEVLCNQGCDSVNGFIADLKAGEEFPEVADLNAEERQRLLEDLVSIMAVYVDRSEC